MVLVPERQPHLVTALPRRILNAASPAPDPLSIMLSSRQQVPCAGMSFYKVCKEPGEDSLFVPNKQNGVLRLGIVGWC